MLDNQYAADAGEEDENPGSPKQEQRNQPNQPCQQNGADEPNHENCELTIGQPVQTVATLRYSDVCLCQRRPLRQRHEYAGDD